MPEKTYNTGRVVGWSSYEEFLKETGTDPNDVTAFMYQTLVTYGVTRIVDLSPTGWKESNGGKFYMQTVRVKGASWGAVPIVGLDFEVYMQTLSDPTSSYAALEELDAQSKEALEEAVGNIFTVYVSDKDGKKAQSAVADHGYLTFIAYPDILKFTKDISQIAGGMMKLIVRGLSMEDLDVNTLYFGPQGFVFAGNGLVEDCYHKTENINNLSVQAGSYLQFEIGGSASSTGGAYLMYQDIGLGVVGIVSGYLDIAWLEKNGYTMTATQVANFITNSVAKGCTVTHAMYDKIPQESRDNYLYMVYGYLNSYTSLPSPSHPIYIVGVRKVDGYTGFGVLLNAGSRAKVGYSASSKKPTRQFCLMYPLKHTNEDWKQCLVLRDKAMPDYFGTYWGMSDGWNGPVSYTQQNGVGYLKWEDLVSKYKARFVDEGRNSYIIIDAPPSDCDLKMGGVWCVESTSVAGVSAFYICTESSATDSTYRRVVLNRRGSWLPGYNTKGWHSTASYNKLSAETGMGFTVQTDKNNEKYLQAKKTGSTSMRIYAGELIYMSDFAAEYIVANTHVNSSPSLVVYSSYYIPMGTITSGVSGTKPSGVNSYTNAIQIATAQLEANLAKSVQAYTSPYSDTTAKETVSLGWSMSTMTYGTLLQVNHNANVFGKEHDYLYQYVGPVGTNNSGLVSSTSQKGGTTLYTLAGVTTHLNPGFPRAKQNIPDAQGSYYYDYPHVLARMTARQFFSDFGLNIDNYLHPDFRDTSMLKFLQNLATHINLGEEDAPANRKSVGFTANYNFFLMSDLVGSATVPSSPTIVTPTAAKPMNTSLNLHAETDSKSFNSPGYFMAKTRDSELTFNLSNPDFPIWATIAKSRFGEQTMSISLIDGEGTMLDMSGSKGLHEVDEIRWVDLLAGLAAGEALDNLAGMRVRKTSTGGNYLVTADGTRLYIATSEPVATEANPIPDGSIGIGW